jgi:glutamate carboxypeptidase
MIASIAPAESEQNVMSVEAKTATIEHLGRQHQAMVSLLADLVNIDSGSYNKRGVDAVSDQLRTWLEAAGIPCETFPNEIWRLRGGAYPSHRRRQPADRADGSPRHRIPRWRRRPAAFRVDGDRGFGPDVP